MGDRLTAPAQRGAARAALPLTVLAVALVAVSFGSIFVRLAAAPALAVALWRMTIAAAVVVPAAALSGRAGAAAQGRSVGLAAAAGLLLALHFAAWIRSLNYTTVAISVLLVNTAPVWVALLGWAVSRRALPARTWVAIALAILGGAVIAAGGGAGAGALQGYALAVSGALAMAGYLLLARKAQRVLPYLVHVGIAFGTAAVALWIAVLAAGTVWRGFTAATWSALAAMAVVSQLVGHGGYNWALRHLQPVFVSVSLTGEPVLAAALAWWVLGEPVTPHTVAGGALVLGAIAVSGRAARPG